jgi:hypothetical protein
MNIKWKVKLNIVLGIALKGDTPNFAERVHDALETSIH